MDVLLQAVCLTLNTTSCEYPAVTTELSGNGINYEPIIPPSTSDVEKESYLADLRHQLNGQTLKVAIMDDFPLCYTVNKTGKVEGAGVAFQLLEFLTEKYNFTYELVYPEKEIYGSTQDMQGSLIELLMEGKADMAAVFVPVMADARNYITFSTTTLDEGNWIMMMNRPGESATGSGLLAPFDRDVWLLILLSLLTVGPSIYGLIIIRMKLTKDQEQSIYPLPHCIWFVYGALLKQGSTLSPLADSTRLLFATWWIFITILTSFYTANLTAFLTLSKFTLPINNVDDILRKNQHFVTSRGGAVEYAIKNENESLMSLRNMVLKERGIFSNSSNETENLINFVERKSFVLIKDRPGIDHLIYSDYLYRKTLGNERSHCPFAISKTPFMTRTRSFAYNKNFTFKDLFDPELLHLVESGIVKYMLLENLTSAEICPQNLGGTERQLRNGDLMMTYQIMMAGFGTGGIIFFTEILFKCIIRRYNQTTTRPFKKMDPFKSVTPPPSYATLFNQSRKNNIWTTHNLPKDDGDGGGDGIFGGGVHKYINGRQYKVVKALNGEQRLIPMRTPSAALFQYSYTH